MNNSDMKNKFDNEVGKLKENVGKAFQINDMELRGKMEQIQAEAKEKAYETIEIMKDTAEQGKNVVVDKMNEAIDWARKNNMK